MGKNTYIFIDVEAAYVNGKQHIIEIGAVKKSTNDEIEHFSRIIKPAKFKKLSTYIQNLTGITNEEIINGESFPKVMKDFKEWCGESKIFVTFGEFDRKIIEWELERHHLKNEFLYPIVDFQQKYMIEHNIKDQPSLINLLIDLNIPIENHHRALADSYSLMEVFEAVNGEELIEKQQTNDFILVLTEWKQTDELCECVITYCLGSISSKIEIESIKTIQKQLVVENVNDEQIEVSKQTVLPDKEIAEFLRELSVKLENRVLITRANCKTLSRICRIHHCTLPKTEYISLLLLLKEIEKVNQFLINGQSIQQYENRVCRLINRYSHTIKKEFSKRYLFKREKITV